MRGKELLAVLSGRAVLDHPRTCGEKSPAFLPAPTALGSPPHMRGKAEGKAEIARTLRITPAHAGKSVFHGFCAVEIQDHPRTCGEKYRMMPPVTIMLGSPPHMRGKVEPSARLVGERRITPAHAGKRLKRSRSTVPHAAIVPLFPSVCNKPAGSDGSPAGHDAPPFLPIENAAPASPAYNLRSL